MAETSTTITIRLPASSRRSLDRMAKAKKRSRSFLIKEALDRYLAEAANPRIEPPERPLAYLLSLRGIAGGTGSPQSAEEIDAHIRWLRERE